MITGDVRSYLDVEALLQRLQRVPMTLARYDPELLPLEFVHDVEHSILVCGGVLFDLMQLQVDGDTVRETTYEQWMAQFN